MADGEAAPHSGGRINELERSFFKVGTEWLFGTRRGWLTVWAVIAFLSLTGFVFWDVFSGANVLNGSVDAKLWFLSASSFFWLPLLLYLLDVPDNLALGPGIALPAISLALLSILTFVAAALPESVLDLSAATASSTTIAAAALFFSAFALVFVPAIPNALILAKHESRDAQAHEGSFSSDNDAIGAVLGTLIVGGIGALAYFVGVAGAEAGSEGLSLPTSFGLGLCAVVAGVFAIIVFLDTLSDLWIVRAAGVSFRAFARRMRWLADIYGAIDWALVRIGAMTVGMGHHSAFRRYVFLAGNLICLSVMGWYLPAPLGLVPVGFAFVLALSVSRLWSWIEDDRALASMTRYKPDAPYKYQFREDYRDETLLGFIFLLGLIPIAMMQSHDGQIVPGGLFENADNRSFLEWLAFFGVELAKAVPIVDWAEIYRLNGETGAIGFDSLASRHAVFLSRVFVDLVLIAALIQAITIANRNRQQRRLFIDQHIDRLDPFVERAELAKAIRATRRSGLDIADAEGDEAEAYFDLNKLGKGSVLNFTRYNWHRLLQLRGESKREVVSTFVAALANRTGQSLGSAIETAQQIAEQTKGRDEMGLYRAVTRAFEEHAKGQTKIDVGDLYRVVSHVRSTSGLQSLKKSIFDKMVEIGPPGEAIEKLSGLAAGQKSDSFRYAMNDAADAIIAAIPDCREVAILEAAYKHFVTSDDEKRQPSPQKKLALIGALKVKLAELGHPTSDILI